MPELMVTQEIIVEVDEFDYDLRKLSECVAKAETSSFTKGYGATHNNGHGIKNGNTAPCPGVPKLSMCKFDTHEESHQAFMKIWSETGYHGLPNMKKAEVWTGGDKPSEWLAIVNGCYYE